MIRRCLSCHRSFAPNDIIESFPTSRRIAYDPERGRLWAICDGCGRWTLAPIETRWEALEELERVARDRGRLLAETDNVALLSVGDARIVRVGKTGLTEEAWWRYGRQLRRRRLRYGVAAGVGAAGAVAALGGAIIVTASVFDIVVGAAIGKRSRERGIGEDLRDLVQSGGRAVASLDRRLRYGSVAWRGSGVCRLCGTPITHLSFAQRGKLRFEIGASHDDTRDPREPHVARDARDTRDARDLAGGIADASTADATAEAAPTDALAVRVPCPRCIPAGAGMAAHASGTGLPLDPTTSRHLLRRLLAYENHAGASRREIDRAEQVLRAAGNPSSFVHEFVESAGAIDVIARPKRLALEIAVNDDAERALARLDALALEQRWRDEERIAAIVDGELTPIAATLSRDDG